MNAEDFYEEYKTGLAYLGVSWADKTLVTVWVDAGTFNMSYNNKYVKFGVLK